MDKQDEGEAIPVHRPELSPKKTEADIYEEASRLTADYEISNIAGTSSQKSKKPRPKARNKLLLIVTTLLIMSAVGMAAYRYLNSKDDAAEPAPSQASTVKPETQVPSQTTDTNDTGLKHYVSTAKRLSLEFDYPVNWTVTPSAAESTASDKPIVLTSPSNTIKDSNGATVSGKVTVQFRPRGPSIIELEPRTATAAYDSVQIAYANPTVGQHKYPFLSFINLGGDRTKAAFEEVIITSTQEYKKDSPIDSINLASIDPLVSAHFNTCKADDCSDTLSITNDTWQNTEVFKQTLAVFQSLKFN